ncbi:MAG: flagellar biosynthesis protein FlhF [Thermodesulfovibrio sp.]|nr:flagellar biosynthesis protein FlhF [Thermodesulfovibrio sp.]
MKIKKFQAKTFSEALVLVKKEMGEDAVILSSDEQPGGLRPYVEVTAAIDYEPQGRQGKSTQMSAPAPVAAGQSQTQARAAARRTTAGAADSVSGHGVSGRLDSDGMDAGGLRQMRKDIEGLRKTIEEMRDRGYEMTLPEGKKKMLAYLKKRKVHEDLAFDLCADAQSLDDLIARMAGAMNTYSAVETRKAIVMIGPTGVGKTTTIAKLSARAMKNGRKVAIINLDTYRIGAIEQIRIYARIMGVPLDIVSDVSDLGKSLAKFSDRDIVFIDTAGRNPRDAAYIEELRGIYRLGLSLETHLLMSAHSDSDFMAESHKYYREIPIDCIGFTKVDEAVQFGSIYNLSRLYRKPVSYITTGQRVPQDIAFPTSERLAGMILKGRA